MTDQPQRFNLNSPAWKMSADTYCDLRGYARPGIFLDCSPSQYAGMSKRAKREYDKRRTEMYDQRAKLWQQWKAEIIAAYEAGIIGYPDANIHRDADMVLFGYLREKDDLEELRISDLALAWCRDIHADNIQAGDRLFDVLYRREVEVVRVNRKSVRLRIIEDGREYTGKFFQLDRMNTRDSDTMIAAWREAGSPGESEDQS